MASDSFDAARRRTGKIVEFDEHRGLGLVAEESGEQFLFHCIELADGSRRIAVGAAVEFEVRTKFQREEAFDIRVR